MTHFECLECSCALWLAESRLLGRCLECRYLKRNEQLARVIAEQGAKYQPGRRKEAT